jgi:hypothetical protein
MLNVSLRTRKAQPSETAISIDLIQSGFLVILAYFIFKVNPDPTSVPRFLKTKVELPIPCEGLSVDDTLNYLSQLEEIHGVEPGNIILLGKFGVSDLHDLQILLNRSEPEMLAEVFEHSIKDMNSLYELIEHCESSVIETKIQAHLSSFYSVSMNAQRTNPWYVKEQFFMPYFEIRVPAQNQVLSVEEIGRRAYKEFHVHSFKVVDGQMRFFCEADEGQFVNTIQHVVSIIEKDYGPDIRNKLENQGLSGATICFHIDTLC